MVDYSDSTRFVFSQSENRELQDRGKDTAIGKPNYLKDSSKPVPIAEYRDKPGFLEIEVNPTTVVLNTGPSGSGKTTGDMSIVTRQYNQGRVPVNLADTDLHTTNLDNHGGVSKELIEAMGLYKGESRREIPQTTVLPKYLWNQMHEDMKPSTGKNGKVKLFSLGFGDVTESELKFLLGQGLDKNQKQAMQSVIDNVSVESGLSFDDLRDACDNNEDVHHSTARKLKRNINVLDDSEVISARYERDLVDDVEDGKALGLGMKGFSLLDPDDYYLMEFVAKKVFEKLVNARKNGELSRPLFSVFPEAHHLMPRDGDSLLADYVKRVATYHQRRSDIPMVWDTQSPSQLPRNLLEEVNHFFVGCDRNGKSLAKSEWSKVLRLMNVVSNPQRENRLWMEKIQTLGHREFLYVNPRMSSVSEAPVVEFLAPLTSNP